MNLNYSIPDMLNPKPSGTARIVIGLCGIFILQPVGIWAQSLKLSPSVASQGGTGSFRIEWATSANRPVVALQWSVRVPSSVRMLTDDIASGSAAESAQKSITCSTTGKAPDSDAGYTCIIAGGQKPIPDGTVAVVLYRIPTSISRGTILVHIEKAIGVQADLTNIQIPDAQNTITVK